MITGIYITSIQTLKNTFSSWQSMGIFSKLTTFYDTKLISMNWKSEIATYIQPDDHEVNLDINNRKKTCKPMEAKPHTTKPNLGEGINL